MCVTPSPESTTTPELRPVMVSFGPAQSALPHTLSVERQHRLDGHVDTPKLIPLKHDLAHLLAVLERVEGRLRQQDLAAARVDLELLEKGIVPQVLHVVPLLDDAVLHGVADLQHGARLGRLVAAHDVLDLEVRAALFLGTQDRPADDGRELEFGKVLRRIADLEEAGAAIEDCSRRQPVSAAASANSRGSSPMGGGDAIVGVCNRLVGGRCRLRAAAGGGGVQWRWCQWRRRCRCCLPVTELGVARFMVGSSSALWTAARATGDR